MTYSLKQKSDTVEATKKFLANDSPFCKIKCLRSDLTVKHLRNDHVSEFISREFEAFLVSHGIRHESLLHIYPIRMKQQREAVDHYLKWVDKIEAKLSKFLWTCAVLTLQPHILSTEVTMPDLIKHHMRHLLV